MRSPRLVIRPETQPNAYSTGLVPGMFCLHVNRGLLNTLKDAGELEAVLAHEVAHLKRLDTVYFSFVTPGVRLARWAIGLGIGAIFFARRSILGRGPSPFMSMMMMQGAMRMGLWGCLFVLFALVALAFLAMLAVTYAGLALVAVLVGVIVCLAYCRYTERQADLDAARLIEDSDRILVALAKTVDYYPSEMVKLESFVGRNMENPADFSLADVVRAIKQGARADAQVGWLDRQLRGHPFVVERIAYIVKAFDSRLA